MRLFYEVRQTNIIIYEYSFGRSRAKKINSALKIAAVRGEVDDLPARCISLLQEVKDLIEAYNSGHENADETAAFTLSERQARPSCTVQQHQESDAEFSITLRSLFSRLFLFCLYKTLSG